MVRDPSVLFVSKPVVPPFRDGTKCLVRELALHLRSVRPVVMSTAERPTLSALRAPERSDVELVPVYGGAGGFTPALVDNARAAAWTLLASRVDLWHFVFAPNAASSAVGRWLRRLRRRPVVQTIASAPREFRPELFFGDVIVAQSEWTRQRVLGCLGPRAAGGDQPVVVIPPPLGEQRTRTPTEQARVRQLLDLPEGAAVFVYPGDLEHSQGAEQVAQAVAPLVATVPEAIVVFACREKTPRAPLVRRALEQRLGSVHVRFAGELDDLPALLALAAAVLFPVDDLWGKVDLPISLLEAMALGVPVIVADHGPLAELAGVLRVPLGDVPALVSAAQRVWQQPGARRAVSEAQQQAVSTLYAAPRIARAYEEHYARLLAE